MTSQTFACLLINLDGSDDRLAVASAALRAAEIAFERLPAYDGRKLDLASFAPYDAAAAVRYMGRGLVGGEIGCYMSHLAAARAFLQTGAQHCLVLEDDAAPPRDLRKIVEETITFLDSADPGWRIVNLGNPALKIATLCTTIPRADGSVGLYAAHYFPMTTGAILWSRRGAQEFLDGHDRIFAPVDNFFRHWITRVGGGYALHPRPVPTTDAESVIAGGAVAPRSKTRRHPLYGLRKQRRLLIDKLIALRNRRRAAARIRPR